MPEIEIKPITNEQHGGKYADHEFVKIASKIIKGVERAPYTKFETILVNYDKMKEIKGKRKLTKSEQRIYDKTDKLIEKEFDAMFKKADTMLDQLEEDGPKRKAQKGGVESITTAERRMKVDSMSNEEVAALDAKADPVSATAQPVSAGAAAAPPAGGKQYDRSFKDSVRPYRYLVGILVGIWGWLKDLLTGALFDKFKDLREQFSVDTLSKLFGNDGKKLDAAAEKFREHAEKIQRLVASGIGGAASASIDMLLNAFSMSPVFGTTILVWRMFQNMLMIMGASLSVQAANNSFSNTLEAAAAGVVTGSGPGAGVATGAPATRAIIPATTPAIIPATSATTRAIVTRGGARKNRNNNNNNNDNNVTKRIKTDIRQLSLSLKRYTHFPRKGITGKTGATMSGGLGSGYSYA
jgi:hypothetical protein